MHGLRNWKLDFKNFTKVYYISNSDIRAKNDDRLNLAEMVNQKRRLGFLVVEVDAE